MKPSGVAGVSKVVKSIAVVALIAAAILVWYMRRERSAAPAPAAAPTTGSAAPTAGAPTSRPPARVKRITPEERKQLAEQIATARKGRAATAAPAGPSLPAQTPAPRLPSEPALSIDDPEQFRTTMRGAMKEVSPYLAECYDKAPDLPSEVNVVAKLTLLGDPESAR